MLINMQNTNKMLSAREAALKALGIYRRQKAWSEMALNSVINSTNITPQDTSLSVQLVYGVLQNMALCDFYTSHFSNIELKKLEPRVLDIIRLSIYQMVFLTKIPHNAAVNEAVSLTKRYANKRAAGYVNALLRKVSKAALGESLPEISGDAEYILSIKYSHPQWLVREFIKILGEQDAEALLKHNNFDNIPITAQVNTLISNTDKVLSELEKAGIEATQHKWLANSVQFRGAGNVIKLDVYKKGLIYVQDAASSLSVVAASPSKGDVVLDGCAAPGGKSFATAIMMENKGHILACDVHAAKLRHIENGSARMGIKIIDVAQSDASMERSCPIIMEHLAKYWSGDTPDVMADIVLADVPCSGIGIIRKKPEIRYKTEQELSDLPKIQRQILNTLSTYVKAGGVLLYSTCTVLQRENEDVVNSFLSENEDFKAESFTLTGIGEVPSGMITLWPHVHGTDGFFICKLRKRNR